MVEVTESAKAQLDEFFKNKDKNPIRIAMFMGCGGETLGLSMEEARDGDVAYQAGGHDFLVPGELTDKASFFKLDFADGGFSLDSDLPLQKGGGSCSGCGDHHHHDHGHDHGHGGCGEHGHGHNHKHHCH